MADVPIEKAAKVVATLARGGTPREALTAAGYGKYTRIAGVMESPTVQRGLAILRDALEKAGVTDERISQSIADALNANTTLIGRHQGEIVDRVEVPDHKVRLAAAELAISIREGLRRAWQPSESQKPRFVVINAEYANVFLSEEELAAAAVRARGGVGLGAQPIIEVNQKVEDGK